MKHDYKNRGTRKLQTVATLCVDKVNAHRMIYADAAVSTLAVPGNSRLVTISHESTKMSQRMRKESRWLLQPGPLAVAGLSVSIFSFFLSNKNVFGCKILQDVANLCKFHTYIYIYKYIYIW